MHATEGTGRFSGKVLFATGGASGIAEQVAMQFTARGGRVAIVDLTVERAEAAAARLEGAIGLGADVSDRRVGRCRGRGEGRVAGWHRLRAQRRSYADFGPIEEYSYERWPRMLGVHAGGTFLVCKHALAALRKNGGSIVNIASTAAIEAQPNNFDYGAAKGAILSFTRQLAGDVAPDGVRVNVVMPGRTRSGITEPLYRSCGGGDFDKGARISAQGIMQKRIAEPEEIANLITFLPSSDASFLTAGVYVADGGETAG